MAGKARKDGTRLVLVGQAPSKTSGGVPLAGRSGRFLAELCGLDFETYLDTFERMNLLDDWPGPAVPKGDQFPVKEGRARAREIAPSLDGAHVLLLGRKVAACFHARRIPYMSWFTQQGVLQRGGDRLGEYAFETAVFPHPSGVNHWWNRTENRERARDFLRDLLEEVRS